MSLFREPKFDTKAEADHARARIEGRLGSHNVHPANYALPLLGAILAIVFTVYALTRPSVKDKLNTKPSLETLEIELE
jgi:hypothetical protein